MKVLVDMNLGPRWADALRSEGLASTHWSQVGDPRAPDHEVLEWARNHEHVVLTFDLGIPAILANSGDRGPSVVLLRQQDPSRPDLPSLVAKTVLESEDALAKGAILVIEPQRSRVRLLPLRPESPPPA